MLYLATSSTTTCPNGFGQCFPSASTEPSMNILRPGVLPSQVAPAQLWRNGQPSFVS